MTTLQPIDKVFHSRWAQLKGRLAGQDVDGLVLTGGSDMEYLTGYAAMPLERITALVISNEMLTDDEAAKKPILLVPELELARVEHRPTVFDIAGWADNEDPISRVAEALAQSSTIAVSDDMWADHALRLQVLLSRSGSETGGLRSIGSELGGLRSIKSPAERLAMQKVGAMADEVAGQLQRGEIPLQGRTESQVAADIGDRLIAAGHETVEFVIVASGPNSASPHHHPGDRVIQPNEMVLCDFGGKHGGYCSDTTRCVFTGLIPPDVAAAYEVLKQAQATGVEAAHTGERLADVDRLTRGVLTDAGYGEYFVHRTGHGIGFQVHEEPYVTDRAEILVEAGHVFSVEPGIYIEGSWGMRLEDIVVVDDDGPIRCNNSDHDLISVTA